VNLTDVESRGTPERTQPLCAFAPHRWPMVAAVRASVALLLVVAPAAGQQTPPQAPSQASTPQPSAPAAASARSRSALPPGADSGNWTSPGRDYQLTRYSGLNQITTENVGKLKDVWSFTTGVKAGHEG
jgi:glucose dehydrogenase